MHVFVLCIKLDSATHRNTQHLPAALHWRRCQQCEQEAELALAHAGGTHLHGAHMQQRVGRHIRIHSVSMCSALAVQTDRNTNASAINPDQDLQLTWNQA